MSNLITKLRYMARQYTSGQFARGGTPQKHYLDEAADEIEALTAKVKELEAELSRWKAGGRIGTIAQWRDDSKQLTAEQDKVKVLTDALAKAREDINWMLNNKSFMNGFVFDYIDEALATVKGEK